MEIQPPKIQMSPSPTLSNSVVVSPETLSSHHSSPAKTSRICYQAPPPHHLQHQVIDENIRPKMPLSISTHHQLTSSAMATPGDHHPHSSISGLSGIHSDVCLLSYCVHCCGIVNFSLFVGDFSVCFGSTTNVPKFGNNTNFAHSRPPSRIIDASFITSSPSSSFRTSTIASCSTTIENTTNCLYTTTRTKGVSA